MNDVNKRSLFFLYLVTFLMFTEYFVYQTVTPLYILSLGGNELLSGLQSTLYFVVAIVLRFYFGPLADRKGNKIVLGVGVIVFTSAPLLFLLNKNMLYIILIRMYQAIGLATYCSCASSLTSILAPKERIGTYIGIHRFMIMSSLIIGPSVTLKLIAMYGYRAFHSMGLIEGLIALLFLLCVREPKGADPLEKGDLPDANVIIKTRKLFQERPLAHAYKNIFFVSFLEALVLSFGAIYVAGVLQDINPGILFTFFGLGSVIGSVVSGVVSDFKSKNFVAASCMVLLGTGIAALAFLPFTPVVLYAGGIIAGFGFSGTLAALIPVIIQFTKTSERTTALSLQESSNDLGVAFGSLFFGILIPHVGISPAFAVGGIGLLLFCLLKIIKDCSLKEEKPYFKR
jgi:MFS family permease